MPSNEMDVAHQDVPVRVALGEPARESRSFLRVLAIRW
jgi:hypothetical protein